MRSSWLIIFSRTLRPLLAVVFVQAGASKLTSGSFEEGLRIALGAGAASSAPLVVSRGVAATELFLGLALLFGLLRSAGLLLPISFLVFVSAVYVLDDGWLVSPCACGVPLWAVESRWELLARNSVLIVLTSVLCMMSWAMENRRAAH